MSHPVIYCFGSNLGQFWFIGFTESQPYDLKLRDGLSLTLFGYAIAEHDMRSLKVKAHEIAEAMGYTEMQIGQSIGMLRQTNLIKT